MTKKLESNWKEYWEDFKKDITWNNIKILISGGLPLALYLYGYTFWMKFVSPFMEEYSKAITIHDSAIALFATISFIAPLALLFVISQFGCWVGRVTKFYVDDKTRKTWWDDITYFVRDMPEEEREKIKQILLPYKSKEQLRKERLADKSWFRRNFS